MMSCYEYVIFFFFKQKTAYEMRISDWSSDVCSSDLTLSGRGNWEAPVAGGTLSANASVAREVKNEDVAVFGADGETVRERKTDLQGELGAQWRRSLGAGVRLDVLGLQRRGELRAASNSVEGTDRERVDETSHHAASIGRVGRRRERGQRVHGRAGAGARNR